MIAFHDGQVVKLCADVHIDSTDMRSLPPAAIEEYVRQELADQIAKQILQEDLIIIKSYFEADPWAGKTFTAELTVIQE